MARCFCVLLLVLAMHLPAPSQARPDPPLATVSGLVRGIDSKMLLVERDDSNSIRFHTSRKTRYYQGSNEIKRSAINVGDLVSVECKEAPDGSMDAVNVHLDPKPVRPQ